MRIRQINLLSYRVVNASISNLSFANLLVSERLHNSYFSGMFRCSDTTFVTFKNRKFLFSRLTLFLLYLYSVFKVHPDFFKPVSGDNEIRTRDPLLARQVLSQLSYIPRPHKMGSSGLEPPTSRLSGVRSNQLSYEPIGLRQPSTLPGSCPPSTIDRLGLNRRVRNGNGCVPQAHHHRRCFVCFLFCLKV